MVNDVLIKYSSLRKKLNFDYENRRKEGRNPTMLTHGFRKFFTVECTKAGVYPDLIELMLGHKLPGVRSHYFKPDIETLLEGTREIKGYIAAIDSLTINEENRLQKQVQELKQQDDYQKYVIDKKISEKDQEIAKLQNDMKLLHFTTKRISESLGVMIEIHQDLEQQKKNRRRKGKGKNKAVPLTPAEHEEELERFKQELEAQVNEGVKKDLEQLQQQGVIIEEQQQNK